ncbi:MAG: PH domain-containing protein [Patescibacteria group bacterium]
METLAAFIKNPKHTFFESQENNEKILYLLRRHNITNLGWMLGAFLMFVSPLVLMALSISFGLDISSIVPLKYQAVFTLIWYLVTAVFALESFLNWYFNVYIVTDKRIVDIDFWGLLYKTVSEATYENIEDVTYSTGGVLQTLFNFGSIVIQTAAEQREFEFDGVPNPAEVYDKITDLVQEQGKKGHKKYGGNRRKP